jgi:phosphotransferase system IIA component
MSSTGRGSTVKKKQPLCRIAARRVEHHCKNDIVIVVVRDMKAAQER